jgi:hypothetical protein
MKSLAHKLVFASQYEGVAKNEADGGGREFLLCPVWAAPPNSSAMNAA